MSFFDKSWLWIIVSAIVFGVLFLLSYLNSSFSTLSIILLIVGIFLLILAAFTGISTKIKTDTIKGKQLLQQKFETDVKAQRDFIKGAVDSIGKVGNVVFDLKPLIEQGGIDASFEATRVLTASVIPGYKYKGYKDRLNKNLAKEEAKSTLANNTI